MKQGGEFTQAAIVVVVVIVAVVVALWSSAG